MKKEPITGKQNITDDDTINRGVTGQGLRDDTNPPGDMYQGTQGRGGDVNLKTSEDGPSFEEEKGDCNK